MNRNERFINNSKQNKIRVAKAQPSLQSMREGEEVLYMSPSKALVRYRKEQGILWESLMTSNGDFSVERNLNIKGISTFEKAITAKKSLNVEDKVAIGHNDPDEALHIDGSTNPVIRIQTSDVALLTGNKLGTIEFWGLDNGERKGAEIQAYADSKWGPDTDDAPTSIGFFTQNNGDTNNYIEHVTIANSGQVTINSDLVIGNDLTLGNDLVYPSGISGYSMKWKGTITTSFTDTIDMYTGSDSRGFYLVSASREGGSVGTHWVGLVASSSTSVCYIYNIIQNIGYTATTSGSYFQLKHSSSDYVTHVTAIPITLDKAIA